MFDPNKWVQSPCDEDNKVVSIAGETIKIRRLNGSQWEHYVRNATGKWDGSAIALILQHGLVKGFGHYSYEEMVKFHDAAPVLADRIAEEIVALTLQRLEAESKILEDAEKNSETISMPLSEECGVENMDKTRKKQQSAEPNSSILQNSNN